RVLVPPGRRAGRPAGPARARGAGPVTDPVTGPGVQAAAVRRVLPPVPGVVYGGWTEAAALAGGVCARPARWPDGQAGPRSGDRRAAYRPARRRGRSAAAVVSAARSGQHVRMIGSAGAITVLLRRARLCGRELP